MFGGVYRGLTYSHIKHRGDSRACGPFQMRPNTQKAFGPFSDFEDCVSTFESDPDVDDPEALCNEMEQNPDEFFGGLDRADSMLQNLKVTFVSAVDVPAQDSEFVMAKHADGASVDGADWSRQERPLLVLKDGEPSKDEQFGEDPCWEGYEMVGTKIDENGNEVPNCVPVDKADGERQKLTRKQEAERKTWAPVLIPGEVDKQGDIVPVKEIESAAHEFLKNHRNIDSQHDLLSGKGRPIESWTLKEATTFEKPDGSESREYPAGTWMLGIEWNDEAWESILSGEFTGLSIFGEAEELNIESLADMAAGVDAPGVSASVGKRANLTPCEWRRLVASTTRPSKSIKQIDTETHEAASALTSRYLDETDSDPEEAFIGGLMEWAEGIEGESADILLDVLADFQAETNAPEDALVAEFTSWMADQLVTEQTEEEEASVERRAVARSAKELLTTVKSMGDEGDPDGDGSDEPTLKDIANSIEETTESVKSVQDTVESVKNTQENLDTRIETLENEVESLKSEEPNDGGDDSGEGDGGDGGDGSSKSDADQLTAEEVREIVQEETASAEEVAESASEKAVAKAFDIDPDDLPDDPEERAEVIRKAKVETSRHDQGEKNNPVGKRSESGEVTMDPDSFDMGA